MRHFHKEKVTKQTWEKNCVAAFIDDNFKQTLTIADGWQTKAWSFYYSILMTNS